MTILKIGDRSIELPTYKLSMMRDAAPAIDRVLKTATEIGASAGGRDVSDTTQSLTSMFALTSDIIEVIAIGTSRVDPSLTADHLNVMFGLGDLPMLQATFSGILTGAGVTAMPPAVEPQDVPDVAQPALEAPAV